jgi:hypothetical protein
MIREDRVCALRDHTMLATLAGRFQGPLPNLRGTIEKLLSTSRHGTFRHASR